MSTNFTNKDPIPKNLPKELQDHVVKNDTHNTTEQTTINTEGWLAYLQHRLFGNDDGKSGAPEYDALEPKIAAIPEIPTIHWTDKYVNLEVAKMVDHNEDVIQLAKLQLLLEEDGQSFVAMPAPYPLGNVAPGFDTIGLKFAMTDAEEIFMFRVESPSSFIATEEPNDPPPQVVGLKNIFVEEDDLNNALSTGHQEIGDNSIDGHIEKGDFASLINEPNVTFAFVDNGQPNLDLPSLTSRGDNITYSIVGNTLYGHADGREIFSLELQPDGKYVFTLNDQIDHIAGGDENHHQFDVGHLIKVTDTGGNEITLSSGTVFITIQDDIPVADPAAEAIRAKVEEDGMSLNTGDLSEGVKELGEGDDNTKDETQGPVNSLINLFIIGADEFPPDDNSSPRIGLLSDTSSLPSLLSKGESVLYDVTNNVLTGYVDNDGDPGFSANDRVVFTLTIDEVNGSWEFDLKDQLDHVDDGNNDENLELQTNSGENTPVAGIDFSSVIVAFDHDHDPSGSLHAGQFVIEIRDDIPVAKCIMQPIYTELFNTETSDNCGCHANLPAEFTNYGQHESYYCPDKCVPPIVGYVEEDGMHTEKGDLSDGNKDPGDPDNADIVGGAHPSLQTLFDSGSDESLKITFEKNPALLADLLPTLYSKNEPVEYSVNEAGDTLTATAGARTVFILTVDPDTGTWLFDLNDQLDHVAGDGQNYDLYTGAEKAPVSEIDFSKIIVATDFDGDEVHGANEGGFVIRVEDDIPVVKGEFQPVEGFVEEDGMSTASTLLEGGPDSSEGNKAPGDSNTQDEISGAIGSLNGLFLIGADEPSSDVVVELNPDGKDNLPKLLSKGAAVEYDISGNTLTASANGNIIFTLIVNPDGSWNFNLQDQLDHVLGGGENKALQLEGGGSVDYIDFSSILKASGSDYDGDTITADASPGSFIIGVEDDIPIALCIKPIGEGPIGEDTYFTSITFGVGDHEDDCVAPVAGIVLEDGLSKTEQGDENDDSEGNKENGESYASDETTGNSLTSLFKAGADEDLTISLSTDTSGITKLFSKGEELEYHVEGNTLTAMAGDRLVFTLVVNPDGSWNFDLDDQLDHYDNGQNDENYELITSQSGDPVTTSSHIDLSSIIIATDSDGDEVTANQGGFIIEVQDDIPIVKCISSEGGENHVSPILAEVREDGMSMINNDEDGDHSEGNKPENGSNDDDETSSAAHHSLSDFFEVGADETLTISLRKDLDLNDGNALPALYSQGVKLYYTINEAGDTLTATAGSGGHTVFTLTVNPDGSWHFDLDDQLDHVAGGDENSDLISDGGNISGIDFSQLINAEDSDGDELAGALPPNSFVIRVIDDIPVVKGEFQPVEGFVEEDGMSTASTLLEGGPDSSEGNKDPGDSNTQDEISGAIGSLNGLFLIGADEPSSDVVVELNPDGKDNLPKLLSKGAAVEYDISGNTLTASANGNIIFTLIVNPDGSWNFNLQDQLDHVLGGGENKALQLEGGGSVDYIDFSSILKASGSDYDGDTITADASPGSFIIRVEDDIPIALCIEPIGEGPIGEEATYSTERTWEGDHEDDCVSPVGGVVLEDGLSKTEQGDENDDSEGNKENGESYASDEITGTLLTSLFKAGADEDLTISLSTDTSGITKLFSKGEELEYHVEGNTLTAMAGDRLVFTLVVNPDGSWNFDLDDQLDHYDNGQNDENYELITSKSGDIVTTSSHIDLSSIIIATDSDGDEVPANQGGFIIMAQDDIPTVGNNTTVIVDDDDLGGNLYGVGDDESDQLTLTGKLAYSVGADELGSIKFLTSDTPDANGFTHELDENSNTLLIKQYGITVLTLTLDAEGNYTVTQNAAIKHPPGNDENNLELNVTYRVTDADGDYADGIIKINVDDDTPVAKGQSQNLVVDNSQSANVMLVLDVSNSMDDDSGIGQLSRFEAAKESAINLLQQYEALYSYTTVQLVTFGTLANIITPGGNWVDINTAIALITDLELPGGSAGGTNYQHAIVTAQQAWGNDGKIMTGDFTNVSYFLSDGQPTVPYSGNTAWYNPGDVYNPQYDSLAVAAGGGGTYASNWVNFVNNNDIQSYAFGMGPGISSAPELDYVAYNGTGAGTNSDGTVITDFADLTVTLTSTIGSPGAVNGDLFNEADIGADQTGYIKSIYIEGDKTYTFNNETKVLSSSGNGSTVGNLVGNVLTIQSDSFGEFEVNLLTGEYTYEYSSSHDLDTTKKVHFTLSDNDDDTSTAVANFTLSAQQKNIQNDFVIARINNGSFAIPAYALLANDIGAQAETIALVNGSVTSNANVSYSNGIFTFQFNNNIDDQVAHFQYKAMVNGIEQTAFVTVTERLSDDATRTVNGTNQGDIIIDTVNSLGGINTINGAAGNDVIIGNNGYETINGGAGDDILRGGPGNDTINGGSGTDIIDFRDGTSGIDVTLHSSGNGSFDVKNAGLGTDTYTSIEGILGTHFNDVLSGNNAANVLSGFGGDDIIKPNGGADTLSGGSGNDTFKFTQTDGNGGNHTVTIQDFTTSDVNSNPDADTLDLSELLNGASNDATVLSDYLDITFDGINTTKIEVKKDGAGDNGVDLTIQLNGVDLTNGGQHNTDQQIIQTMLNNQNLHAA